MRLIPAAIPTDSVSRGERELLLRLQAERHFPDWTVLHSLNLAGHVRFQRGEADFVFVIPGSGILVVEVKGHSRVSRDPLTGLWHLGHDPPRPRSPFRQATEAMFSIREQLARHHPEWLKLQFEILVVFPFTEFRVDDGVTEWQPWQVVDRHDLTTRSLAESAIYALECAHRDAVERRGQVPPVALTAEASAEVVRTLCPAVGEDRVARRAERNWEQGDLHWHMDELDGLLAAVWRNDRLLLRGGPGTGKTALLLKAAHRAAAEAPGRVRLVCFNRLLAAHLRQALTGTAAVSTLHQLLGTLDGLRGGQDLASRRATGHFEPASILLLDEAQDLLHAGARAALDQCVEGGLQGGRVIAALDDLHQHLYQRADLLSIEDMLPGYVSVDLMDNRRNRPRISALASSLSDLNPWRSCLRDDDRVEPLRQFGTRSVLIDRLSTLLGDLGQDGFEPQDIVILSGCKPGDSLAAQAQTKGLPVAPVGQTRVTDVGFTSIYAFKGLEAPVVVLTDLPHGPQPDELMLVGLTRSTARAALLVEDISAFADQYVRRTV